MPSKILVVDDEPDVAEEWARALRLDKHNVSQALDSATALKLCRENPFDLVVLDYMMPTMTGIELLNEIRKKLPYIRSVIISGKLDSGISEEDLLTEIQANIEVDAYLHKPVETSRLKEAVNNLLAKKPDDDWVSIAKTKLEAVTTEESVRTAEKKLNKKKTKKK